MVLATADDAMRRNDTAAHRQRDCVRLKKRMAFDHRAHSQGGESLHGNPQFCPFHEQDFPCSTRSLRRLPPQTQETSQRREANHTSRGNSLSKGTANQSKEKSRATKIPKNKELRTRKARGFQKCCSMMSGTSGYFQFRPSDLPIHRFL